MDADVEVWGEIPPTAMVEMLNPSPASIARRAHEAATSNILVIMRGNWSDEDEHGFCLAMSAHLDFMLQALNGAAT